MLNLYTYSRKITALLAVIYILSGTGLGTFLLQGASHIYAVTIFPCQGSGCACDIAGHELAGCECDHQNEAKQSCCPVQPEPSCCNLSGEVTTTEFYQPKSCNGQNDSENHSLAKHISIDLVLPDPISVLKPSEYVRAQFSANTFVCLPLDKVPISS
jgi:hypothetical protein